MPRALFDIQPLLPALAQGSTVITPNNRLRNQMRLAFSQASNHRTVRAPNIFSLEEWLNTQWQILVHHAHPSANVIVLNELQLDTLWLDILVASDFADPSANYQVLAAQLAQAYSYLVLWQIPHTELDAGASQAFANSDTETLKTWFDEFTTRLTKLQAITPEQRQQRLLEAFTSTVLTPLPSLCLQGFDDLPPLTQALVDAASAQLIDPKPKPHTAPLAHKVDCNTLYEEAKAAAQWTQDIISKTPDATVGIIVPNLGQERHTIERAFIEVLEPQFLDPSQPRYTLPFNISAGIPLSSTPIICDTLLLLRLGELELPLNDWLRIFHSPFFGDISQELTSRSQLATYVRKLRRFTIRGADIREHLQKTIQKHEDPEDNNQHDTTNTQFAARLQDMASFQRQHSSPADANTWIERIQTQLELLQWPGSRRLDSVEYQQVTQWYALLEKLAGLDFHGKALTHRDILSALNALAARTHFQAEVKSSPIYILGTLEGAGLEFDYCWILGMNNQDWPPRPTPNPLLPLSLQRHYQLPRASLERETRYAQSITEQLLHCAPNIVVSYAAQQDEVAGAPSVFVEHLPDQSLQEIISPLDSTSNQLTPELEWVDCTQGPPLITQPGIPIKGGSDVLKQQALCPFNSFAKHRLGANPIDKPVLGLTPLDKGNIIHRALELFWSQVQTATALQELSDDQLQAKIATCVDDAFAFTYKRNSKELGEFYYQIEQQRFIDLLLRWLLLERERSDFTVVAREAEVIADFAGLTFKLRIDRVDQLTSGELLLIDYKTGSPKEKSLYGDRIEEPQLPLYLLCYTETAQAISFAKVNNKEPGFTGLGSLSNNQGLGLSNTQKAIAIETWPEAVEYFRRELTGLAQEFMEGYCAVVFKNNEAARYATDFTPLNRIEEQDYISFLLSSPGAPNANNRGEV